MKTTPVRLVIVMVFLLIATGISSAAFPQGTYATVIARGDIPASLPPRFVPVLVGNWEITFAAADRFTIAKNAVVVVEGQYTTTDNQIIVGKEQGSLACTAAGTESGTYNWAFDGKNLTLKKVRDECGGRVVVLTAHPLAKRK